MAHVFYISRMSNDKYLYKLFKQNRVYCGHQGVSESHNGYGNTNVTNEQNNGCARVFLGTFLCLQTNVK